MKQIVIKKWIDGKFREVKRYSEEEVVSIRHHTDGLEIILKGNIRLYDAQCIIEFEEKGDDNIGKHLLNWFKDCKWDAVDNGTLKRDDIIAWLEKQGEQKLLNNDKYQTVSVEILDRLYESEKELERLKIRKKGEGEIPPPQSTNKENKTEKKSEKTEKKDNGKKIPSAKKRLSSAKPSKEVAKKIAGKKANSRIQSAKNK